MYYIKIINNRDIKNVVNMTRLHSTYFLELNVPSGTPLETYETILQRELPKIREKNAKILSGPTYVGVSTMSADTLTLLIKTTCREGDFYDVKNYVNREVWIAIEREGIKK